jgi:hypothetical protein
MMRRLAVVAGSAVLLSGVAAGLGTAAYASTGPVGVQAHHDGWKARGDWDRPADHRHDRFDHGYYWRESGGVRARWDWGHRRWERENGHRWEHWNGHHWVG